MNTPITVTSPFRCRILLSFLLIIPAAAAFTEAWAADVTLVWDASTSADVVGYTLYRGTAPGQYTTSTRIGNVTTYTVTGLTPATYYFAVTASSSVVESTFSNEVQVTIPGTDATLPAISAVAVQNPTASTAAIRWNTNEPADTQVEYGTTAAYGSVTTLNSMLVTAHTQSLSSLKPVTTYHYRVKSRDAAGNLAVSTDATFTTLAAADTTAPLLSAITVPNITSSAATVQWITNEAADTQVEYGRTTAYGSLTILNPTPVTSHAQALSRLSSGTLYHFRVKSRDAAGNLAVSADGTFTTVAIMADPAPLTISSVSSTAVTRTGATILWTTNRPADSQVQYGTSTAYSATAQSSTLTTSHSINLSGLAPGKTYHYSVKSKDAGGILAVSPDYTFTTQPESELMTGLVAYYGFDEGTGTTTVDSSPNGNTATLSSTTWSTLSKYGRALSFNGTNSFLSSTVRGLPDLRAPKTIACWLYLGGTATHTAVTLANPSLYASVKLGTKGSMAGVRQDDGTWIVGSPLPWAPWWHFYAWVFDGSVSRLYVDGMPTASSTVWPKSGPVTVFQIGRSNPASEYFNGTMDELMIYNRALTQSEVVMLMALPSMKASGTRYALVQDAPSTEAATATAESEANTGGPNPAVSVRLTQNYYTEGETVSLSSCSVSNPSERPRRVEPKFWIEGPGYPAASVAGSIADDVALPPRHDEDYAPMPLFAIDSQPGGTYRLGARLIDPVTGDTLSQDIRSFTIDVPQRRHTPREGKPSPAAGLEPSGEFSITNPGTADAVIEVKMWLESPGHAPVALLSAGTDGSLVLRPGEALTFNPLGSFQGAVAGRQLRARVLDPATGQVLSESTSVF